MRFRIGVNLGDIIVEQDNLYGTGVNVAVRLEQLAEPGGICISQTVYDQVRKIVEIPFEDIGERRLKNISDPVHVYRILPSPLPWLRRLFSRSGHVRRFGAAAGVLLLLSRIGCRIVLSAPACRPVGHRPRRRFTSRTPVHRRHAFRRHESERRPAISCRWNHRGTDHGAGQVSRSRGHGSQLQPLFTRTSPLMSGRWERISMFVTSSKEAYNAPIGRARDGAADRCEHGAPNLVRPVRSADRGHLQNSRRNHPGDRWGARRLARQNWREPRWSAWPRKTRTASPPTKQP